MAGVSSDLGWGWEKRFAVLSGPAGGSVVFPVPSPTFEADMDYWVFFWVAVGSGVLAAWCVQCFVGVVVFVGGGVRFGGVLHLVMAPVSFWCGGVPFIFCDIIVPFEYLFVPFVALCVAFFLSFFF
jgi:hypothetical protein